MHRVFIDAPVDYVVGHLRYGHYEGTVELSDEEFERFEEDPEGFLRGNESLYLDFLVDDWEVDSVGEIESVEYREFPV